MEPVTGFATIASLLAAFKSERRGTTQGDYQEFLDWLQERRHEELAEDLKANLKLAISIKALLHENTEELLARFDQLDRVLAHIASGTGLFGELAASVRPGDDISEQARSILRQLVYSGAEQFFITPTFDGPPYPLKLGGGLGKIAYDEPRFLQDDLDTLVGLGLLGVTYGEHSSAFYRITRAAVAYVEACDQVAAGGASEPPKPLEGADG